MTTSDYQEHHVRARKTSKLYKSDLEPSLITQIMASKRAESPTTAREPDFDDDQEAGITADAHATEEVAPPKPPRPLSPRQEAEKTLQEAFPTIDAAVVKAVLTASGGNVEPAFNALLGKKLKSHQNDLTETGMSDPDSHSKEAEAPPQPPRPDRAPRSQIESDELYARQLAEHYSGTGPQSQRRGRTDQYTNIPRARKETGLKPNELYDDREHSFIDGESRTVFQVLANRKDDLPVIRENLRKGFLETQFKVNRWVSDLKKKIDGEDEMGSSSGTQGYSQQPYPRRSGDYVRRSADRERYDADPKVLGDDFGGLELRDDEGRF
jgi:hypothetical protein